MRSRLIFTLCLLSTILTAALPIRAQAATNRCAQALSIESEQMKSEPRLVLNGKERSLKDLDPIFRALVSSQTFDLVIPRNYRFKLASEAPHSIRHGEKDVEHFPYHFDEATTDEEKYYYDLLDGLRKKLEKLQFQQEKNQPIEWVETSGTQYQFNPSPTTGRSHRYFGKPDRVVSLLATVHKYGRPPFMYADESGSWHITNKHFLQHLKDRGVRSLTLFRAHSGFDVFFYRLLLSSKKNEKGRRQKMAAWLRSQAIFRERPPLSEAWWMNVIHRLEDSSEPLDKLLLEMAQQTTTSAMFTSLTTQYSNQWIEPTGPSELIRIKLDLEQLPDWYLEQIFTGSDLDTEIVMPFTNQAQIDAMRRSLTIERSGDLR